MEEPAGLLKSLQRSAVDRDEGDARFRCLSMAVVAEAAGKHDLTTREVSIFALEHGLLPYRYVKNVGTVGLAGQARLLGSRALVVGAGGIGGSACELLARMGVGTIVLVDPDTFDETNLNRQNFCCGDVIATPRWTWSRTGSWRSTATWMLSGGAWPRTLKLFPRSCPALTW